MVSRGGDSQGGALDRNRGYAKLVDAARIIVARTRVGIDVAAMRGLRRLSKIRSS